MRECKVLGCQRLDHKGLGFCGLHYDRHRKCTQIDRPIRRKNNKGAICEVDGCGKTSDALGLCNTHYVRKRKSGVTDASKNRREYGSGKDWHKGINGYVVRYEPENKNAGPNGQVYQHRHVVSVAVGRPLKSAENVHHINGVKCDNRLENLELWSASQPAGQRLTDRVAWCAEFLTIETIDAAIRLRPDIRGKLIGLAETLKMM